MNLMKMIIEKVGKMTTTDVRVKDKEAVKVYMTFLASESLVVRHLKVLRSLADNDLEAGSLL